jgi:hypothetical protein
MMYSLPSVICVNTALIMLSSTAMYSRNRIPAFGAFITGDEDKYFCSHQKQDVFLPPSKINLILQMEYGNKYTNFFQQVEDKPPQVI